MRDDRQTAAAVSGFHGEFARWPSAVAASGHESSLGRWLNSQRVALATGAMDPFRRAALDQAIPGWAADPDTIWLDRAREASDFLLSHRYTPSPQSPRYADRTVAIWILTQQCLERTGGLRADRLAWLEEHCPGWRRRPVKTLTKRIRPVGVQGA